jgi:broad specificity phosphatase PhoE
VTRLLLIRHGETAWNVEGRWQGQADVPLNQNGIEQAARIAGLLEGEKLQAIYSSDLQRAYATALRLAKGRRIQVLTDRRLREIDQGEWQGLLVSEIERRYTQEFQARRDNPLAAAPPGGETARQVQERVLEAVYEILGRHPGGTVGIVSHGFALALVRVHFLGLPIQRVWELVPNNGEIIVLDVNRGGMC